MRISGGDARGIRLKVPKGARPASERVRQAVLSSLAARIPGAWVLDLYCGSGAYGLEALSRGADSAVFVDSSAAAIRTVEENARTAGLHARSAYRRQDVQRYLSSSADGPFDVAFCDPPYEQADVDGLLARAPRLLRPDGLFVLETRTDGEPAPSANGWTLHADRRYGDTRVLAYRYTAGEVR